MSKRFNLRRKQIRVNHSNDTNGQAFCNEDHDCRSHNTHTAFDDAKTHHRVMIVRESPSFLNLDVFANVDSMHRSIASYGWRVSAFSVVCDGSSDALPRPRSDLMSRTFRCLIDHQTENRQGQSVFSESI